MLQKKSKKIFIYLFVFLIIGTINNKDINKINFTKISKITVSGLDNKNNFELLNSLNYLKVSNLFFIDQHKIERVVEANNLVEKYSISKKYPSTLDIKINKTIFLAQFKKKNIHFFLGSNGKFIKVENTPQNVPYIFGDFKIQNFFELKNAIDETNFNYDEVKNFFFFKSGRWDIETKNGIVVKLPKERIKYSLQIFVDILSKEQQMSINSVDLRQHNQIIINGH
jgi:cell division protein FtsQ